MESYRLTYDRLGDDLDYFIMAPADKPAAPPVLCLHGLQSRKESLLDDAVALCRAGLRAVAPDMARHGRRKGSETRDAMLEVDYVGTMFAILGQSAVDIVALLDHLGAPAAGLYAISMGGIIGFAAMVGDSRVAAASMILASPDWVQLAADVGVDKDHPAYERIVELSPLTNAAAIAPRPLLMLNGDSDDRVPIVGARRLHEALLPLYREYPDRLCLKVYPDHGHVFTDDMQALSVDWLANRLSPSR